MIESTALVPVHYFQKSALAVEPGGPRRYRHHPLAPYRTTPKEYRGAGLNSGYAHFAGEHSLFSGKGGNIDIYV